MQLVPGYQFLREPANWKILCKKRFLLIYFSSLCVCLNQTWGNSKLLIHLISVWWFPWYMSTTFTARESHERVKVIVGNQLPASKQFPSVSQTILFSFQGSSSLPVIKNHTTRTSCMGACSLEIFLIQISLKYQNWFLEKLSFWTQKYSFLKCSLYPRGYFCKIVVILFLLPSSRYSADQPQKVADGGHERV